MRRNIKQPIPEHARKVFEGVIFDVYQWDQKLYNGNVAIFEKLRRADSVIVFPILDDGRILLTEQEQPGVDAFISAPGGRVDSGEEVLDAAKRELLEETGYEASDFILWDVCQPVLKMDYLIHIFVAKKLKKVAEMHLDGGEKIGLKPVTFDAFLDIALGKNFDAANILRYVYEAKFDAQKREELKDLLSPSV